MSDSDGRNPQRWRGVDLFAVAALITAVASLIEAVRAWW